LRGTSPVSKVSDNEHTAAALGHSEVLSVKNPVGDPIPEFAQHPEEGTKIFSSVAGQDTGDVFPDNPGWSKIICNSSINEHEISARVIKSFPKSRDAERLARCSSDQKVDCSGFNGPLLIFRHVADFRYVDTSTGLTVVEDVKGMKTDVYKIKRKLLLWRYPGIDFRES